MKMIVMINKVASTSTASMATIAPAISSPRLFEPSDATTGSREPVVDMISLISPGSVTSIVLTVGRGGVCLPLPVIVAMLVGTGVGSFVEYGAFVVENWKVVVVSIEDKVMLGVIGTVLMLNVETDEGHG